MSGYGAGVTVSVPRELGLGGEDDREPFDWHRYDRSPVSAVQAAKAFPQPSEIEPLDTKLFACSGGLGSTRYREATTYRLAADMNWEEARVALRRLYLPVQFLTSAAPADYVALAALALTTDGRSGFVGRKGDHAGKLREELSLATGALRDHLLRRLDAAAILATQLARPIPQHVEDMASPAVAARIVGAASTMLPVAGDRWVQLSKASPDDVSAALEDLRARWAAWSVRRSAVDDIIARLQTADRPSATDYAEAVHSAEMLCFVGEKLTSLYAGIMFSMPIYRLYPATPEPEAIGLWWPWGRPALLMAGPPPQPRKSRRAVLDPALITATRPQDIVREIVEKTGINRTTAQAMTADMRRKMRSQRKAEAGRLLRQGVSKAEVARRLGLSPSRISALFPGKQSSPEIDYLTELRLRYPSLLSK